MDADQIVVMDEGCVTGVGNHMDLLRTNQEYREIYESQMHHSVEDALQGREAK